VSAREFVPRPDYAAVPAYRAERTSADIDLGDSTNQWGTAPSALKALASFSPRDISEYPAVDPPELVRAFADYAGVAPDMVISGCGSDDLLDVALRALAAPGERVAHPAPTFAMAPIRARANSLVPVPVPVTANGDLDADAMLATRARVMYLCTPNNPTGVPHSRAAVERVVAAAPGIVIVDEAYAEFADDVFTPWAARQPGVVVLRTLSKSFGLAGLRIGFALAAPVLLAEMVKARGPFRVNALANRAAAAALTGDRDWIRAHAANVREVRARFVSALARIGFTPLQSQANFVCVPVPDAARAAQHLAANSIVVRPFAKLPVVGDVLRIGLAPWPALERVLAALAALPR